MKITSSFQSGFHKIISYPIKYLLISLILISSCQTNPVPNPISKKIKEVTLQTGLSPTAKPSQVISTSQAGNPQLPKIPQGCTGDQPAVLHSDPDPGSEITSKLDKDKCADLIRFDRSTRWVYISGKNSEGWVSLENIQVNGALHDLPASTPSPLPPADEVNPQESPSSGNPQEVLPESSSPTIHQTYHFESNCKTYELDLPINPVLDSYFSNQDKAYYYTGELPDNWRDSYYRSFLISTLDQDPLQTTIELVRKETGAESIDELAISLIRLTQHLDYNCDKLFSYENLVDDDYDTSFPYETLADQSGVCGDFSLLMVKLLKELGYGTALLLYDQVNHMAAGIQCPLETASYVSGAIGYCYIETTAPTRIGFKPKLINDKPFTEDPHIIPISSGDTFFRMTDLKMIMDQEANQYGDSILGLVSCAEISLYKTFREQESSLQALEGEIFALDQRLDNMKAKIDLKEKNYRKDGCEGNLSQEKYDSCLNKFNQIKSLLNDYNQVVNLRNHRWTEYNALYDEYRDNINEFNQLIDNRSADCSTITYESFDSENY